ncbi:sulfite exporter TauE/SafE family protein [archaeon]|nr:MAG: sulfite exporter TauE/SafE family protein [archaeon]
MTATEFYVGGCISVFCGATLAAAAGVGGGGIMIPLLLIFFQYSFTVCVPLSLCVVLGNAISQFYLNSRKRSPYDGKRPMIWWELIVLLLPAQLGGSNVGTLLSYILPSSVLYILALLILLFAGKICFQKAITKRQLELEHATPSVLTDEIVVENPIPHGSNFLEISFAHADPQATTSEQKPEVEPISWPVKALVALGSMWICYVCLSVGRTQTDRCSDWYIVLFILAYLPLATGLLWSIQYNQQKMQSYTVSDKDPHSLRSLEEKMMKNDLYILPVYMFLIGMLCSLLGIGGGELISPLLLSYHVSPVVTSATSSTMGLLTSLSVIARDLALNEVAYDTGLLVFLMGLLGGYIGRKFGLYMTKINRASVIIFALCGALCCSASYYVYKLIGTKFDGSLSNLCDS